LVEAQANIRQGVDPALLEREHALSQQINAKAERQIQALAQNARERAASLNKDISALEDEYQQVQVSIRQASPAYAALTQPQPLGLKEIQAQLDQGTMLLEYSLGEEHSYVWAVTQSSLKAYELPGRETIEKATRVVYDLLTTRGRSQPSEDLQLRNAIAELSQMVLGPVSSDLGKKRLVIVADGALQYVPFAALSVSGQPLILDHEIVSLPSASALAIQRHGLRNRKPAPNAVAVIADPVFSASDVRVSLRSKTSATKQPQADSTANTRIIEHVADKSGLTIRRLKFTRQEADQILAEAPRGKNLRAVDFKANRAIATGSELSNYRYVHFATHGYIDSERPDLSAIVLSLVDEHGQPEDGFLRAHEIYNLDLPAELVVLSACETGLGKEIKGEGLVGLTRGFMYAGARRVVVSLWNVNDKATAELMARFYRGMLRDMKTPAAALRSAQIEMSRQRQWQSPYYWSAFVLQGEWK
jgi:CHAT domain-containing protein